MIHYKRSPRFVAAALFGFILLLLCSCGKIEPGSSLAYGKKYVHLDTANDPDKIFYYIFEADGTGVYRNYAVYKLKGIGDITDDDVYAYDIHFVYQIANGKVMCFYDSVEINPSDNQDESELESLSSWHHTFEIAEDMLINADDADDIWVLEDFLMKIPNFGKPLITEE